MTKRIVHRLVKVLRSGSKRSLAVLKTASGARIKVGLIAAILFALVCAVETKVIFALESSQDPFEVTAGHGQSMYR
jgi:hypothetical protein